MDRSSRDVTLPGLGWVRLLICSVYVPRDNLTQGVPVDIARASCPFHPGNECFQLVSTDNHSNVRNSQHTIAVDIPTLCRDDLVILPKGAGNRLQGTLCVVHRVTSVVQFVGPFSGET